LSNYLKYFLLFATGLTPLHAQMETGAVRLNPVTVIATRSTANIFQVGAMVNAVNAASAGNVLSGDVADILEFTPAVNVQGGNLKGKQFPKIKNKPVYIEGLSETDQIALAEGALKAMSLTRHFARLVMITGHSSTTINNPHRAGLDCGACGGQSGEANARLLAQILNEANIRIALKNKGINIPEDTIFLACEHDTCTDDIIIFNSDIITQTHSEEFKHLKHILAKASVDARAERALRLGSDANIIRRSRDWSQVRPEWGLAGCTAFVVAPRYRTQHLNMSSSTFMHSYNWQTDDGFKVLELIMTAPMVVTNWINMQYYASMVDQKIWGSGNKTLHNVVGNVGVIEGNAGDIRSGLPIQSLHDGQDWQHEPLRLAVYIEAPKSASKTTEYH
jgi:hypothetical protein